MQAGQPYSPFKLFTGIFIPEALVQSRKLSLGAKVVFGRMARYAGEKGECYPRVETLAAQVGISERQAQRYLAELEDFPLIYRKQRGSTSSLYQFLWNPIFEHVTPEVTDVSPLEVTDVSPLSPSILIRRESVEESHLNVKAGVTLTDLKPPLDEWVEVLYSRHPKKRDRALVGAALVSVLETAAFPQERIAEINRVHLLWCETENWQEKNGRFAPTLAMWLDDHGWTQIPKKQDTREDQIDKYLRELREEKSCQ